VGQQIFAVSKRLSLLCGAPRTDIALCIRVPDSASIGRKKRSFISFVGAFKRDCDHGFAQFRPEGLSLFAFGREQNTDERFEHDAGIVDPI
jgi:hypothetical protein